MSFELEVQLDGVHGWIGNACYYETGREATLAGLKMSQNSMRVREMRVVEYPGQPARHVFNEETGRTETLRLRAAAMTIRTPRHE